MKTLKRIVFLSFGALILFGLATTLLTPGEDYTVQLIRSYPVSQDPNWIRRYLHSVQYYKDWHFAAIESMRVDGNNQPLALKDQLAEPGALILLTLKPKGLKHRQYQALLRVEDFNRAAGLLKISVMSTTNKKIEALFSSLSWTIALTPNSLDIQVDAKTKSFKSRYFAHWTPTIFLNQAVLANFALLAAPTRPEFPSHLLEGKR